ncbi:tetratricopeptide repeat protein [Streptosporangium subroseum]|uniref:tetratricopeptide repeat protein n=1 Tax=Streptosporangium subroseum TaxID=106412 RepID=UPI00343AAEA5
MSTPPTDPDPDRDPDPREQPSDSSTRMEATASGQGRVYQARRDMTINEHQTVLSAEAIRPVDQVAAPQRLVNVPVHTHLFVGRSDELTGLERALASAGPVVVAAVHGLGGVGKSTLAARYAVTHARAGAVNPVWWITADTPASIEAGMVGLAVALQPELATVLPLEALAQRAFSWLACHQNWLLVLDNVTTPAHIQPLLAQAPTGRFLITSRLATGWHQITSAVVRLDVLEEDEALDLLTAIATLGRPGARLPEAARLCAELGYLPLAIEQAGAYLHQSGLTPSAYLDLLAGNPAVTYDQAAEGADAERTIARIWRATLDHLSDTPLAGQVLRILAWYASEAIPRTLLEKVGEPALVQRAIGRLAAYNMITVVDDDTLSLHRLVQAVARTPDPNDPHRAEADIQAAHDQATRLLDDAIPTTSEEPADWPRWRILLPHIAALTDHPDTTDVLAHLLNESGLFLRDQGAIIRSIDYFQRAHTASAQSLGVDHPNALGSRNNLGSAYRAAGDLGRAIPLLERTLADYERVLGTDHPDTLGSRNNLAGAYESAGDLGRAIPLHERTLADYERVLGTDHPDTLGSRNNLASAYQAAGDLKQAISLFERTLADRERILGTDHPSTLSSRNNLAGAYQAAGNLRQAIPLHERTLADRERVLGIDHPSTLISRNNLASAYRAAGDLERAIPWYERTLADYERVLDSDHPDTLTSRNNLASAYQAAGDLKQAISLFERTLADRERILGTDHPSTLTSRNNLASAYRMAGDLGRGISLFERTLADRERVLGIDHPSTLISRNNLASAYRAAGDLKQAISLFEQTLADYERVLDSDHPDTLTSRNNLASAYRMAGDLGRAIPLYERTLADYERVLGTDHPTTKVVRANLSALR